MAALMLGSFTNGLFAGANFVQDMQSKGEEYKRSQMDTQQKSDMMGAAREATEAGSRQKLTDQVNAAGAAGDAAATAGDTAPGNGSTAPAVGRGRTADGKPDLGAVPQPNHLVSTGAVAPSDGQGDSAGASGLPGTAAMPSAGARSRELQGYSDAGPPPALASPVAPTAAAPSNMQTYDVPMSQPGALSSGQGNAQGQAINTGPAPTSSPARLGPNLSQAMTNRPVGAAFGDWLHGRQAAPRYLPPGQQPAQQPAQASPIISGMSSNPSATPNLGNGQGGLGAQLLKSMNPGP